MYNLADIQSEVAAHIDSYLSAQLATATASYGPIASKAVTDIQQTCQTAAPFRSGCLTYIGYLLSGGQDNSVALEAALAIELAVAGLTLDNQANSTAARTADHMAEIILANMPGTTAEDRIKAVSILHRSRLLTLHERAEPHYFHYVNAVHTGMVLAGGDCHDTDDITPFAKALACHDVGLAHSEANRLRTRWDQGDLLVSFANVGSSS